MKKHPQTNLPIPQQRGHTARIAVTPFMEQEFSTAELCCICIVEMPSAHHIHRQLQSALAAGDAFNLGATHLPRSKGRGLNV